ncbi:protein of unknown function [Methylocella tundrae]|uniref:Uncharacterized protein n=1 Tax=Methylocella tundrae TaxID=227605 RepID=A0A4U8YTM5_METTU|nr:protein of unknown function [Methylocella tundrae]
MLYALAPTFAHMGSKALFVASMCIILSMYGGGFATVPAYLADVFGTRFVGAIHGRLLTAWSTAGIVGPVVIGYIRDAQIAAGINRALVYDRTMYILAGFLGGRPRLQRAGSSGERKVAHEGRAAGAWGDGRRRRCEGRAGRFRHRRWGLRRGDGDPVGAGRTSDPLGRLESARKRRQNVSVSLSGE